MNGTDVCKWLGKPISTIARDYLIGQEPAPFRTQILIPPLSLCSLYLQFTPALRQFTISTHDFHVLVRQQSIHEVDSYLERRNCISMRGIEAFLSTCR